MNDKIVEFLKQNREKLKAIEGKYDQNDYSVNSAVDEEFYSQLSKIDLKSVKNKIQFFSLINELAIQTVDRTVKKVLQFSTITDFDFGHDLRINELYLKDLMDNFINNLGKNVLLAKFYKTQIDYLSNDLKTTPWGKQYVYELFHKVGYEHLASNLDKMIDSMSWSLYWNEEFQNNRDMIKYAISRDVNEINNVPSNIKEDKQFMLELLETNPGCYFGMSTTIKADNEVAKFIIGKDWRQFASFADDSLRNEDFLKTCNLSDEDIKMVLEAIKDIKKDNQMSNAQDTAQKTSNQVFNPEAYNCSNFLTGLNNCKNVEEVKAYIDNIG